MSKGYDINGRLVELDLQTKYELALIATMPDDGIIYAYKAVRKVDLRGPYQYRGRSYMTYTMGKIMKCRNANTNIFTLCGAGISVAPKSWAENLVSNRSAYTDACLLRKLKFYKRNIACIPAGTDGKFRVHRCRVVELEQDNA